MFGHISQKCVFHSFSRTFRTSASSLCNYNTPITKVNPIGSYNLPESTTHLVDSSIKLTPSQSDLLRTSMLDVIDLLSTSKTSSVELAQASLSQIKRTMPMNSYISVVEEEHILKQCEIIDKQRRSGENLGRLGGIPIAIKDNYCVKNTHTTCASKMLANYVAPYDSTVTARLEKAGGIVMGKTNLDEFAMGSNTVHSAYGPTVNPWSLSTGQMLSAGGSSGGSAVAVISGSVWGATGTDTGGSVRLPAAWTGIVGYKPTYGLSSRFGMVQYASSLDTPAIFAKTTHDAALIASVINGSDVNDSTSIGMPESMPTFDEQYFEKKLPALSRPLRIGIPREYFVKELPETIKTAWTEGIQTFQAAGCEIVEVSLPHTRFALPSYYVIAPAEASSNLARYDGIRYGYRSSKGTTVQESYTATRTEAFGEEVQRRIMIGNFALSRRAYESYYKKSLQLRRLIRQDYLDVFGRGVDLLLTPVAASTAPSLDSVHEMDPIHVYITDIMTLPANLAGLPAISVPTKLGDNQTPIGLQLLAPPFHDALMLHGSHILEKVWTSNVNRFESLNPLFK